MEIGRYLEILQRRWRVVLSTLFITLAIVAAASYWMKPVYSASSMVRIADGSAGPISYTELNYAERLMSTHVQLLKTRPFMEQVIRRLDLSIEPDDLSRTVKVEALANTQLIKITVSAAKPDDAARIADVLAGLLVDQGQQLYAGPGRSPSEILQTQLTAVEKRLSDDRAALAALQASSADGSTPPADAAAARLIAQIRLEEEAYASLLSDYNRARLSEATRGNSVSIAESAAEPKSPSRPRPELYIPLGFLFGLIGGLGLAFLFDRLDPRVHSSDDLVVADGPTLLGSIPEFDYSQRTGRNWLPAAIRWSPAGEAFRLLSANVLSRPFGTTAADPPRGQTLLVTSAEPGVGKSTVLANLAVAIAGTGRRVVVVDSNLRQPALHRLFDLHDGPGLADVLLNPNRLETALQESKVPGLRMLASGTVDERSPVLLSLSRASDTFRKLAEGADVVLLDSPSMLDSADAALLAPLLDGVLMVAARDRSTGPNVARAADQIQRGGAHLLGVVFNRAKAGRVLGLRRSERHRSADYRTADAHSSYQWAKRAMDVVLSGLALVALSPLLLAIAMLIKRDSPGPVIFAQERMGFDWRRRQQRIFRLYKFRSMVHNADQSAHRQFIQEWIRGRKSSGGNGELVKLTGDPRITAIGRFLRRTSLDELPQLWNVLKGDMSLVGPRPVPLYEVEEYEPWHKLRLQATPGITCLWQVKGRGLTNIDDMVRMDLEYIENQSLWLDFKLLLHTIPVVLTGRGAA